MKGKEVSLTLTAEQHGLLQNMLFPEDGSEAVAIVLCGRRAGPKRSRLLVQELFPIPISEYKNRTPSQVSWQTDCLVPILEKAEARDLSVMKIHSHRSFVRHFSLIDDKSDEDLLPCIAGWVGSPHPHVSAVMLPDGSIFGRAFWPSNGWMPLQMVGVIGADLRFWKQNACNAFQTGQAFADGTTNGMNLLTVGVVGCSGTGSIVVEQLARLGVGRLVLVDGDRMAERNLGRVLNAGPDDARDQRKKVEVLAASIRRLVPASEVEAVACNLWSRVAVERVAECDVVFGCMDSHEGRFLLNILATDYLIPYFDIGVRLDAQGVQQTGAIRDACGTIHYLLPGRSSLVSRGLVSLERVREEGLRRNDHSAYCQQVKDGYILGKAEQRPAVISINMFAASLAVNDFLARVHLYRDESNDSIASIQFSLASLEFFVEAEGQPCSLIAGRSATGDQEPLLGMTEFSRRVS